MITITKFTIIIRTTIRTIRTIRTTTLQHTDLDIATVTKEDVVALDVTVNDCIGMEELECL